MYAEKAYHLHNQSNSRETLQSIHTSANMHPQASCRFESERIPLFFELTEQFIMTASTPGFVQFIDISGLNPANFPTSITDLVTKTINVGPLCAAAAFGTTLCVGSRDGTIRFWDARTQ